MKRHQLQRRVPASTVSLFVMTLVLGLLSSKNQTKSLTEQELIAELFNSDVLEVHSDDSHYFRFLDPILTNIAIDVAVSGSRYESAWEINQKSIMPDRINIFSIDSREWTLDATDPICIFRRNAVYLPSMETIVVDVQAAQVIVDRTDAPEEYIDVVMAWILGHEIGHAVLDRSSPW